MVLYCCHTFLVNCNDNQALRLFLCALDCCMDPFIIWAWEHFSGIILILAFLTGHKKLCLTTKQSGLGIQKDGWSCSFQSLHISNLVVGRCGSFSGVPLTQRGLGFVERIVDHTVRIIAPPGVDWKGSTQLPCSPEPPPPPSTLVEGALSGIQESVTTAPTPLEGKEACVKQSVEGADAKAQPSMAALTEQDTGPKVLIRGEWRKVPDGYLRDASGQLEGD